MDYNYSYIGAPGPRFQQYSPESEIYSVEQQGFDLNMIDPSLLPQELPQDYEFMQQDHPVQVQKFLYELERPLFKIHPHEQDYMSSMKPYAAQSPFPYNCDFPGDSPSSTESSSALSPRQESEPFFDPYLQSQGCTASSPISRSISQENQEHYAQNIWPSISMMPQASGPQFNSISLSDLQAVPDPEEVTFPDDEGYSWVIDQDSANNDIKSSQNYCRDESRRYIRYKSDSAIGHSIQGDDDAMSTIIVKQKPEVELANEQGTTEDADAEGEDDEDDFIPPAEEEDAEADPDFSPRSNRPKRKRTAPARHPPSNPPKAKRSRTSTANSITTTSSNNNGKHKCSHCGNGFSSADTLKRHVQATHTRPYVCTFKFAGCKSTFGNKNEWKRHVSSQHLGLKVWVCTRQACGASKCKDGHNKDEEPIGTEFNRKDLLTQHLRRMHAPFKVKHQKKEDAKWDEEVKRLQRESERVVRAAPGRTGCPLAGCGEVFVGENGKGWDERMEHVGRHLEEGAGKKIIIHDERDEMLVQWAVGEGIIKEAGEGRWGFSSSGAAGEARRRSALAAGGGGGDGVEEVVEEEEEDDEEDVDADGEDDD